MAEVHLAATTITEGVHELVVVKRMHQQHLDDSATVRMFLDEARLALQLHHPNIVAAHRLGMFDGRHGIVMEYLEGQPLQRVLKRAYELDRTFDLDMMVRVGIAALDGLHYAHERCDADGNPLGVVHRDVSPQNLFITYEGGIKLLDFGIAKNAMQEGRTRTGLLKGKISYMAPEQARGEDIDRRADLWGLGVIMWEAATGSRLFKGANEAATLHMTLTGEIPPPSDWRGDLPESLEKILMRALERDPDRRYPTAAAMRDELQAWLNARNSGDPKVILSSLMQRLFSAEMAAERDRIQTLLSEPPESTNETGVTIVAPVSSLNPAALNGTMSGLSGLRGTQVSSVTDLVQELTRQRRATTRLLSALVGIVALAALLALYLLSTRSLDAAEPVARAAAQGSAFAANMLAPQNDEDVPSESATGSEPSASSGVSQASTSSPAASTPHKTAPAPRSAQGRNVRASDKLGDRSQQIEVSSPADATRPSESVGTGLLNLDTSPWSIVSVGGRVLGQTPIVGASLPAGNHALVLTNPELGIKTTYMVTIVAGQTTARRVGLD
jgi:serine/threonine-protein kinase